MNYITEKDFDIVLMTQTWLKPDKDDAWKSASCVNRNGYTLECCDRLLNKGGSIGIIYKSNLKVKTLDSGLGKTFEFAVWQINLKNEKPVQLVGISHAPPSELYKHIIMTFTDEFLEKYVEFGVKYYNMLIVGDFNIHVEDVTNGDAEQFIDMCKAIGLDQHVNFATHHNEHTLDLVLTELNSAIQMRKIKPGEYISDHFLVDFIINYEKEISELKSIEFKN